jgi:hypothetical protein
MRVGQGLDAIADCAARGVRAAVVFSSGFSETGEAVEALQHAVQAIAAETGSRVLGPNCLGAVSVTDRAIALDSAPKADLAEAAETIVALSRFAATQAAASSRPISICCWSARRGRGGRPGRPRRAGRRIRRG